MPDDFAFAKAKKPWARPTVAQGSLRGLCNLSDLIETLSAKHIKQHLFLASLRWLSSKKKERNIIVALCRRCIVHRTEAREGQQANAKKNQLDELCLDIHGHPFFCRDIIATISGRLVSLGLPFVLTSCNFVQSIVRQMPIGPTAHWSDNKNSLRWRPFAPTTRFNHEGCSLWFSSQWGIVFLLINLFYIIRVYDFCNLLFPHV